MEVFFHDEKKHGWIYNEQTRLYEPIDKMKWQRLGSPAFYFTDIRDNLDVDRKWFPVNELVINKKNAIDRGKDHFFTWTCKLEYNRTKKESFPLISLLRKVLFSKKIKTLKIKETSAMPLLREYLSQFEFIGHLSDKFIHVPSITHKKYLAIQKYWIGLIENPENYTVRRCLINNDKELPTHLLIFNPEYPLEISTEEVEKVLKMTHDEFLTLLLNL